MSPGPPRLLIGVAVAAAVGIGAVLAGTWYVGRSREPILRYDPQVLIASAPVSPASQTAAGSASKVVADPAWVSQTAQSAGIPAPAMQAYADAALRLAKEEPDCGIGWTTLAGIGYVESQHGTIDGRALRDDGRSDPLILGPALNGVGKVAAIASTAQSARWHGDTMWDHAVGPLQFIPSSWVVWASDGDGDGETDPNDIDDAAYAAGRYLCADGRGMDGAGWSAAVHSYNHSDVYVRQVYDAAAAYASRTS